MKGVCDGKKSTIARGGYDEMKIYNSKRCVWLNKTWQAISANDSRDIQPKVITRV